jgi:branched-chain amino acid transport system permease protein
MKKSRASIILRKYPLATIFVLLLAMIPPLTRSAALMQIFVLGTIYVVLATSWDLLSGYTGQLSFGHSLFFGIGAYATAFSSIGPDAPPLFCLVLGGITAAFVGLMVGLPCTRLSGIYLTITTLAASESARLLIITFWQYTGGDEGVLGVAPAFPDRTITYFFSFAIMLTSVIFLHSLTTSRIGLTLKAIREDSLAAEALGINTTKYKLLAFVVSSFFAGIAGSTLAQHLMYAGPTMMSLYVTFDVLIMSVIGGMGTIVGPAIGAFVLVFVNENLRFAGGFRILIYGVVLVLTLKYFPEGLISPIIRYATSVFRKIRHG